MKAASSDWYRVLDTWKVAMGREGVSFSFLVGVVQYLSGATMLDEEGAREYARNLYDELVQERRVNFRHCSRVGGTVVELLPRSISSGLRPSFHDLWEEYGSGIVDGQFSFTMGAFSDLEDDDDFWDLLEALGSK